MMDFWDDRWPILTVTSEELGFALRVINDAASGDMATRNPEDLGFDIADDSGPVESFMFTDNPWTRGYLALGEEFGPRKGFALGIRVTVLMELMKQKPIVDAGYIIQDDKKSYVSPRLIEYCASLPLSKFKVPKTKRVLGALDKLRKERGDD